ncbi:MAG: hypothetical protein M1569_03110 [Candidatus Marsarchaeota archaeon]|nr:hypothetical protein [Candidatus Marsarchaeota archaeon]MCL5413364.1 hypothetical protein [Candidatus Marsarchaeota archaeon]
MPLRSFHGSKKERMGRKLLDDAKSLYELYPDWHAARGVAIEEEDNVSLSAIQWQPR